MNKFVFFLLLPFIVQGQNPQEISKSIEESLCFLENQQELENTDLASLGEWPSVMSNEYWTPFLGPEGKQAIDYNNFTTASIAAILGEVNQVKSHPKIPLMLKKAGIALQSYQENDQFYFWKKMDKTDHLKKKTIFKKKREQKVRRPSTFELKSKFINNIANIPADADDTALSYLAYKYINQNQEQAHFIPHQKLENKIKDFRDHKRKNAHFMNVLNDTESDQGAYLTWLKKEKMFSPWMWIPSGRKENITFGTNDVDCVVNANILTTLSELGETGSEGYNAACDYVNKMFIKNKSKTCGGYYPSPFNLHYSAAKAFHHGATCLGPSIEQIVKEIKNAREKDGSFSSHLQKDRVHSSLYALNALLLIGNEDLFGTKEIIDSSMNYILSQKKTENGCSSWEGGAFFSGGTIIRDTLLWRSDAYTTTLALQAFSHYLNKKNIVKQWDQSGIEGLNSQNCQK
jgi:hypothetical protein